MTLRVKPLIGAPVALPTVRWGRIAPAARGRPQRMASAAPPALLDVNRRGRSGVAAIQARRRRHPPPRAGRSTRSLFRPALRHHHATVPGQGQDWVARPPASATAVRATGSPIAWTMIDWDLVLTEAQQLLKACQPGESHALVDLAGFRRQLDELQEGAEKRLVAGRQKKPG
ncbi:MAG: hypothetical protein U1F56_15070 [Rubrivivax sp.]